MMTDMNTKTFNEILLRRRNMINIKSQLAEEDNAARVGVMVKNFNAMGYTFSKSLVEKMSKMSSMETDAIYKELMTCLKSYVGDDKKYNVMYKNFPACMMDDSISDFELFINAIVHYISGGTLYPEYEKDERLPLFESPELKVIDLGTDDDLDGITNNLISAKTSLSEQDKEDLIWLLINRDIKMENLPDVIPFKENKAVICSIVKDAVNPLQVFGFLNKYMNTATDILRWLVFESDGDVSLAKHCKFRSFTRKERDLILHLLNECGLSLEEDMLRYKNVWIKVGEKLHPSEDRYRKYTNAQNAFYKLRNNVKIETFNGKVEKAIFEENVNLATTLLKTRPGNLARKLDELLRKSCTVTENDNIIEAFKTVANQVSVPVLLQVKEHFAYRHEDNDSRVFFPKGSMAKVYTITNKLDELPSNRCNAIVKICEDAIKEQFALKESLGKVYISDSIKGFCIPQSQRSASNALKVITRGSELPINKNAKVVRSFIWWTDTKDNHRVDIDLSAAILDENFGYKSHVSYTRLRDKEMNAYHSGDITSGGDYNNDGVSECLDINIDSVVENGGRYVIFQVYSYTGQKFSDMDHSMFGFMEREEVNSGEIFEPSTVEQKMNLTSQSTVVVPVVFDCVERKYIWLDIAGNINGMNRSCANLEGNLRGVSAMVYGIVHGHKPQMYDLAMINVSARGELVSNRDDADTIFDIDTTKPIQKITKIVEVQNEQGKVIETRTETEEVIKECKIITPYDTDIWQSELL